MKFCVLLLGAAILVGCSTKGTAESTYVARTESVPGWQEGDAYQMNLLCMSEEAGKSLFVLWSQFKPEDVSPVVGCIKFPADVPITLIKRVEQGADWEGDLFELWKVREFFRHEVYVILWVRPALAIPPAFLVI